MPDEPIPDCVTVAATGEIRVTREAVRQLHFEHGLAGILVEGKPRYVRRDGVTAPALWWDNGVDRLAEGRIRTIQNGRIGFLDRRLREVVPAAWDYAWPFEHGVALVCRGCVVTPGADEHPRLQGGRWGYIDRRGRSVIEAVCSREELPSPGAAARCAKNRRRCPVTACR